VVVVGVPQPVVRRVIPVRKVERVKVLKLKLKLNRVQVVLVRTGGRRSKGKMIGGG
jgi:hypothetical protein